MNLSDEQLDALAGGYILDLKGSPWGVPYAVVDDKWGRLVSTAMTLEAAEDLCTRSAKWRAQPYGAQVINLDEYYQIFGKVYHP